MLILQFLLPSVGFRVAFPWLPVFGSVTTFASGLLISKTLQTDKSARGENS